MGLQGFQARDLAYKLGFKDKQASEAAKIMSNLAKAFTKTDASLAEINPLVVTKDGKLLAIDAKFNFDANAMYRHPEIAALPTCFGPSVQNKHSAAGRSPRPCSHRRSSSLIVVAPSPLSRFALLCWPFEPPVAG